VNPEVNSTDVVIGHEFFRDVLKDIHELMAGAFGLHSVKVIPMGSEGARLSIPVRIEGLDPEDRKMIYFGKILGGSDIMTLRAYQFFKNIFLNINSKRALFDFTSTAKEMAKHQYDGLSKIYDLGIPTAKPYGYYPLIGGLWFFVAEFLETDTPNSPIEVSEEHLEQTFQQLSRMHRKKIFHGDIKPENFIFADQVYIMDLGHFLEKAPQKEKRAYDLACTIASFLGHFPVSTVVKMARKYYTNRDIKRAADYIELIDRRPDFKMPADKKEKLIRLMQR